jgi:hypothetical protein
VQVIEDRRDDPRVERLIQRIERRYQRARTERRRGDVA